MIVDPQDMEDIEAGLNGDGEAYAALGPAISATYCRKNVEV